MDKFFLVMIILLVVTGNCDCIDESTHIPMESDDSLNNSDSYNEDEDNSDSYNEDEELEHNTNNKSKTPDYKPYYGDIEDDKEYPFEDLSPGLKEYYDPNNQKLEVDKEQEKKYTEHKLNQQKKKLDNAEERVSETSERLVDLNDEENSFPPGSKEYRWASEEREEKEEIYNESIKEIKEIKSKIEYLEEEKKRRK